MRLTISFEDCSVQEAERVLHLFGEQVDLGGSSTPSREHGIVDSEGLRNLVWDSTEPMLRALRTVAHHSALGEAIPRGVLVVEARLVDEGDLNGVLGSIGRGWAKHLRGQANPMLGISSTAGIVYRISSELAIEVMQLIGDRAVAQGLDVS